MSATVLLLSRWRIPRDRNEIRKYLAVWKHSDRFSGPSHPNEVQKSDTCLSYAEFNEIFVAETICSATHKVVANPGSAQISHVINDSAPYLRTYLSDNSPENEDEKMKAYLILSVSFLTLFHPPFLHITITFPHYKLPFLRFYLLNSSPICSTFSTFIMFHSKLFASIAALFLPVFSGSTSATNSPQLAWHLHPERFSTYPTYTLNPPSIFLPHITI